MKKLITIFMITTLFLSIASIGMAAKNKQNNAPDLQKITFVHYAKDSKNSKPIGDDTADIYKLMYGGIRWTNTMQYEVNYIDSGLDEDEVLSVLGKSLETWDSETSFELFNNKLGTTTEDYNSGDRINRVTWGSLDSGIIAVNSFWFNTRTKEIVESDVQFNTYYSWSTNGASSAMDLQNIATHEFGHNGLNDLYMPPSTELTMYGYSDFGETDKRTLGTGDISGIKALYG